jgi:hypothetical protein
MSVQTRLQKLKEMRLDLQGEGGKFHQNINLLFAIILGLLIPELALLVAFAWLFGWLNVNIQHQTNSVPA